MNARTGARILGELFALIETRSGADEASTQQASAELAQRIGRGQHPIRLMLRRSGMLLNGQAIPVDLRSLPAIDRVTGLLRGCGIDGIQIDPGVTPEDLVACCDRLLAGGAGSPGDRIRFLEDVGSAAESTATSAGGGREEGDSSLQSVAIVRHLVDVVDQGRIDRRLARVILQGSVDLILAQKCLLPALQRLQLMGPDVLRHSVGVCVFSAVMARALGLSDNLIAEVAVAALLHDVGGIEDTMDEEWDRDHVILGIEELLSLEAASDLQLRCLLAVCHHHDVVEDIDQFLITGPGVVPWIVACSDRFERAGSAGTDPEDLPPGERILATALSQLAV